MTTRNCSAERTSLSTAEATPSTRDIGEAFTEAVTKYRNYNANETDEERDRNTLLQTLRENAANKIRYELSDEERQRRLEQEVYCLFNVLRCNDR